MHHDYLCKSALVVKLVHANFWHPVLVSPGGTIGNLHGAARVNHLITTFIYLMRSDGKPLNSSLGCATGPGGDLAVSGTVDLVGAARPRSCVWAVYKAVAAA